MKDKITVFWYRRDLRVEDNTGFYTALSEKDNVLPLFIFDQEILEKLDNKYDARVDFIYRQIKLLKEKFEKNESSLLVKYGKPIKVWQELNKEYEIEAIYTNRDYEPYAIKRDLEIEDFFKEKNISFNTYKDQVIFEKDEVLSGKKTPYTIYTPYKKKWRERFSQIHLENYPSENKLKNLFKTKPLSLISLKDIGFNKTDTVFPKQKIDEKIIKDYDKYRDIPELDHTSKLSIHLRFGTISIRNVMEKASLINDTWFNELIWREFFMMILSNFPHVVTESFRSKYDKIKWLNNEDDFKRWCEGKTGYPIVDAGMRELNETGYMHNRVRLITASFLTKHLLIDWRWGERYFAKKLHDYELSSNNGNWQWCAGTGCDAAPYFRVFNPVSQTKKFDPKYKYIKKWIPELHSDDYPKPVVEHAIARVRALQAYKEALKKE